MGSACSVLSRLLNLKFASKDKKFEFGLVSVGSIPGITNNSPLPSNLKAIVVNTSSFLEKLSYGTNPPHLVDPVTQLYFEPGNCPIANSAFAATNK